MDDFVKSASREALLYSLPSDTLLILNKVSLGMSDKEIVLWGEAWSFTGDKVVKALAHAYKVLNLEVSEPGLEAREALSAFMEKCRQEGLLSPKISTEEKAHNVFMAKERRGSRKHKANEVLCEGFDINNKDFKKTLFQNIKRIAKVRRMPMTTIAKKSELQPSFLSFLNRGQVAMDVERLTSLSRTIGVSVDFLLTAFVREGDEIRQELEKTFSVASTIPKQTQSVTEHSVYEEPPPR